MGERENPEGSIELLCRLTGRLIWLLTGIKKLLALMLALLLAWFLLWLAGDLFGGRPP